MKFPDLNLILTLDALLREQSVTAAAESMHLSAPAMSRQLGRLRVWLNDPLLVRAGRQMVCTPRAEILKPKVLQLVDNLRAFSAIEENHDFSNLEMTFTIRASDAFVCSFSKSILYRCSMVAPHVRLCFLPEGLEDLSALREGLVDIEVGVLGAMGPEVRVQTLFRDNFRGIVCQGHSILNGELTLSKFVSFPHISVSRRGRFRGPLDMALEELGSARIVPVVVGSLMQALAMVRTSDYIAVVPDRLTSAVREGLQEFELPVTTEPIVISLAWHPRNESSVFHRWMRDCIRAVLIEKGRDIPK